MDTLKDEMKESDKLQIFETLKGSLTGAEPPRSESTEILGMTEGAVKVTVHRMRQPYREIERNRIAETVSDPFICNPT